MEAEVPQTTLEYRGGQLNTAPLLEVRNFTNLKKIFFCYIVGIEPQFKKILLDGPYVPNGTGVRKPEAQWSDKERKTTNLDQRLKSLIVTVLPDVQMNFVINCKIDKST
ncbi:hypothetical protein Tco_0172024 [Tanacetum coccineum]